MKNKIQSIDRNMADSLISNPERIVWYDASRLPIKLGGFAFFAEDGLYRRLPLRSAQTIQKVNHNINDLCTNTSGGQIRFKTTSDRVCISVELGGVHDMVNMTAIGQCGFDLYIKRGDGDYIFWGVTRYRISDSNYACQIVDNLGSDEKEILINFPLYCGVNSVKVGLDMGATISCGSDYDYKFLFYGTSITQGGCATRPGMAYTNLLSRWYNAECINFGFSANGLGEPEMAELIGEVASLDLIVLDYEANSAGNGRMKASLKEFIAIIRGSHKNTPILVLSRVPYVRDFFDEDMKKLRNDLREFQWGTVQQCRQCGDDNIYFFDGYKLFSEDCYENTVDFIHPTDLGFLQMAQALKPIIAEILGVKK